MDNIEFIVNRKLEFLKYLKLRLPLYHMSNVFSRDLQYNVQSYFADHGTKVNYPDAEKLAAQLATVYEQDGIYRRINRQTWRLSYPEFTLPRIEKKAS